MSKAVDLDRLAEVLRDYRFAYFITVDDDFHAHTTTVTPTYDAGLFDVGPIGRHGRANLSSRGGVTLVWPPREVADYSLIVDGHAELPADPAGAVRVKPTRALLHRPMTADSGPVYDCVVLSE
ncbi:MAG TPA: hypothetical protein VFR27_05145 [Mycobacterium sp.]|nr:hypothetical protein [Mycobacterium sp.]